MFICLAFSLAFVGGAPSPNTSHLWKSGISGCDSLAQRFPGRLGSCQATNIGCTGPSPDYGMCDCLVVNDTQASDPTMRHVRDIEHWENNLASVQLASSLLSLTFGLAYLFCFAVWPSTMWQYPLSLAFWIYACDLCVSSQFVVLSAARLFTSSSTTTTVLSSDPRCLCELGDLFGVSFPGCECNGGWLSFLVQGGLAGSVAFYFALAHNFYASVRDPFTRPKSRLVRYHVVCWSFILLVSIPYLMPESLSVVTGYGYRYELDMCWSPDRNSSAHNLQSLLTTLVPLLPSIIIAPLLYYRGAYLLRAGGEPMRHVLLQRREQMRQVRGTLGWADG